MKRREFIAGLGGAAAWPLAARAQQRTPVVAVLAGPAGVLSTHLTAAFRQEGTAAFQKGLGEQGYIDGQKCRSFVSLCAL